MNEQYSKYLRDEAMPSVWCPGCGNGLIVKAFIDACRELNLEQDDVAVVGGIGCSGRTPYILDFNTMHVTHGRAPAYATGLKLANPELEVVVMSGDGDSTGIGGNHFIHVCRRDLDMTLLIFNNEIYGLTGGQAAPTTPNGVHTTTSPGGNVEGSFDICQLAEVAGASFVARSTTFDFQKLRDYITRAIRHRGLSVVEIMTACPTYRGRLNQMAEPIETLSYIREMSIGSVWPGDDEPPPLEGAKVNTASRPLGIFVDKRADSTAAPATGQQTSES